jgi:hypothetical protein
VSILPVLGNYLDAASRPRAIEQIETLLTSREHPAPPSKIAKEKIKEESHLSGNIKICRNCIWNPGNPHPQLSRIDSIVWDYGISDWQQKMADYAELITRSFLLRPR